MKGLDILILAGGILLAIGGFSMLWPPKRRRASAANNWQQRDGSEMFEASDIDSSISPETVAVGLMSDSGLGAGN
jgi:hypothetical protein